MTNTKYITQLIINSKVIHHTQGKIKNLKINLLINSGLKISLIFNELYNEFNRATTLQHTSTRLQTVNLETLNMLGKLT